MKNYLDMTVGQLRAAMVGVPDEAKLTILVLDGALCEMHPVYEARPSWDGQRRTFEIVSEVL